MRNAYPAFSDNQAAQFIREYWNDLWQQQELRKADLQIAPATIANTLTQHFPNAHFANNLAVPTVWEVLADVQKSSGTCGCDDWKSEELHALPEEAVRMYYALALHWHEQEHSGPDLWPHGEHPKTT